MIEVIGLGGPKLTLVLLPGLLASGIGALVSIGMGSWTGLSTSAYALGSVEGLAKFARPDIARLRVDDRARARRRVGLRAHGSRAAGAP